MRVLHVLHTSLPHVCGYSLRSDKILSIQRKSGIEVSVITSAQQPDDAAEEGVLNQIPHFRTPPSSLLPSPVRELQLMRALGRRLRSVVEQVKPDVIHAHSPVLVGLPAYFAARRRKVPFVYEIRDLWENASVDRGKFEVGSLPYRAAQGMETWLLRRADAVVTIGETLRRTLALRANREILVTPNGVDTTAFKPAAPEPSWVKEWNPEGGRVMAYIGAFQPYEGLEILIKAMPYIVRRCPGARLLIVGDGPARAGLEFLASREGVAAHVTFPGRLPHARVHEVYAVADFLIYPRVATLTTELTTPLKPLEALAMEKAVLVSDLPALRELVSEGSTGLLFEPGNVADLADKALQLLDDAQLRDRLGKQGRAWVVRERGWESVLGAYYPTYRSLLDSGLRAS